MSDQFNQWKEESEMDKSFVGQGALGPVGKLCTTVLALCGVALVVMFVVKLGLVLFG